MEDALEELIQTVSNVLFEQWDPCGINGYPDAPRDEYRSVATGVVYGLLNENFCEGEVYKYLDHYLFNKGIEQEDEVTKEVAILVVKELENSIFFEGRLNPSDSDLASWCSKGADLMEKATPEDFENYEEHS